MCSNSRGWIHISSSSSPTWNISSGWVSSSHLSILYHWIEKGESRKSERLSLSSPLICATDSIPSSSYFVGSLLCRLKRSLKSRARAVRGLASPIFSLWRSESQTCLSLIFSIIISKRYPVSLTRFIREPLSVLHRLFCRFRFCVWEKIHETHAVYQYPRPLFSLIYSLSRSFRWETLHEGREGEESSQKGWKGEESRSPVLLERSLPSSVIGYHLFEVMPSLSSPHFLAILDLHVWKFGHPKCNLCLLFSCSPSHDVLVAFQEQITSVSIQFPLHRPDHTHNIREEALHHSEIHARD